MRQDRKITIDKDRLRQYNAMKPAARGLLVTTVKFTAKMMWGLLRFAFRLPGMVKRAAKKE
ncbi:MAG: hypothetical protein Q8927_04275 [Bacteroidota bacterium]|nr:hypothetical protein [Bacteroidota bacterium]MDP4244537.1 hypothetical protein [Bacteroidota bacterium]MDP4256498.1 hypothetical protein [Bacteroidota bacterium]MDP4259953.1 hypothetical protein [Bacteroidota bacterium]